MRSLRIATLALALFTVPLALVANAAAPPIAGTWSGQIQALGQPALVTLTLSAQATGFTGGMLWGGKAQCRTVQEFSGVKSNSAGATVFVFVTRDAGGGFCDRFWNGALELTPDGADRLDAAFISAKGESLLQTKLTRTQAGVP